MKRFFHGPKHLLNEYPTVRYERLLDQLLFHSARPAPVAGLPPYRVALATGRAGPLDTGVVDAALRRAQPREMALR